MGPLRAGAQRVKGWPGLLPGLRWVWLFPLALVLQIVVVYGKAIGLGSLSTPWLLLISYVLLLAGVLSNLRLWGFRLLLVGVVLNLLAMALNGGRMPVSPEALARAGFAEEAAWEKGSSLPASKAVLLHREDTRAWPLTDIVAVTKPRRRVVSIGDLLIMAAVPLILVELVARRRQPSSDR